MFLQSIYLILEMKLLINRLRLYRKRQRFCVHIFDMGSDEQGIVHMVGPETGLTQPGKTIVCGDSHTATHGAFGAIAFGIEQVK